LPVSVVVQKGDVSDSSSAKLGKVKNKEVYVFSRQLANLLRSGVALLKSLDIIAEQTQHAYFKSVIANLAMGVKNGKTLSECLADYPKVFSSLYVTMVHAGEESGNLRDMLLNVAIYQKEQEDVMSKVRMALIYPVFMAFAGLASVYFILTFVVPKMSGLFSSMGNELPFPTVILLSISTVLSKGWLWVILVSATIAFVSARWIKSEKGKTAISYMMLNLPVFGEIVMKSEMSRFCRTLVLLLKSGVSIIKAINMSVPVLGNETIKGHLSKCESELTAGGSFGDSLMRSGIIPPMMGHLISIGEESGNLNDVLTEIAEAYEQEVGEKTKIMTTLLEPIMILLVGLVIGFIVFALLLPIFQVDVFAQ